jgi:hypothetical protein
MPNGAPFGLGRPHFHPLGCTRIAAIVVEPYLCKHDKFAIGLADRLGVSAPDYTVLVAGCPHGSSQQLRDYCHADVSINMLSLLY